MRYALVVLLLISCGKGTTTQKISAARFNTSPEPLSSLEGELQEKVKEECDRVKTDIVQLGEREYKCYE